MSNGSNALPRSLKLETKLQIPTILASTRNRWHELHQALASDDAVEVRGLPPGAFVGQYEIALVRPEPAADHGGEAAPVNDFETG